MASNATEWTNIGNTIDAVLGPKHQDVACVLRQYIALAAGGKSQKTPQDACDIDLDLDGALHILQQKDGDLAQLLAAKLKAKKPQDTTGYKPPKPAPGKTPGKTPPPAQPPVAAVVAKPINWKPVLKWGGLVLVLTAGGYYAWQKLQAR